MAERSDPWPTLTWVGVLCGIALGAVIVLLFRRNDNQPLALPPGRDPDPDPDLSMFAASLPSIPLPTNNKLGPIRSRPIARTLAIRANVPTMVLQAVGVRDWTVWVRVIGPPGAFATFTISDNTGDAVEIPAGGNAGFQMKIPRGEFLYAAGSTTGVRVSAAGGQDGGRDD